MTFSDFATAVQWAEQRTTNETFFITANTDLLIGMYQAIVRYSVINRPGYTMTSTVENDNVYYNIILPY